MKKEDLNQSFVFALTQKPAKKPPFFPPTSTIVGTSRVIDPDTGKERLAIYMPSATSIWVDEISALKDEKTPSGKSIKFINGFKTVSAKEQNLLKFLRVCGQNEANDETRIENTILFRELNREKKATETFDTFKVLDNARYFVSNAPEREVRAYALALAKTAGELTQIQQMSEFEVRLHLRHNAEKNPTKFLENMKDTTLMNKVKIIEAIYADVIVLNEEQRTLAWKGGNEFIEAPIGIDPVTYLSDMATKHEKFDKLIVEIQKRRKGESPDNINVDSFGSNSIKESSPKESEAEMEKRIRAKVLAEMSGTTKQSETPTKESNSENDSFVNKLLDKEVLIQAGAWLFYKKDTSTEKKWQGKNALVRDLDKNKLLKNELEAELEAVLR